MPNISNLFESRSAKVMKIGNFAQEFWQVVIIAIILKLLTHVVSGYLAYSFVITFYEQYFNSLLSIIATVITLLAIELSTSVFITKFFKFILRGSLWYAIFSFTVFVMLFTLSIMTSINGIKTVKSNELQASINIDSIKRVQEGEALLRYNNKVNRINNMITTIKGNPVEWTGNGKRDGLSKQQLTDIQVLENKLDTIYSNYKDELTAISFGINELQNNLTIKVKTESNVPMRFVLIALLLQVLCTFFIIYTYYKTLQQTNLPEHIQQSLQVKMSTMIENTVDKLSQSTSEIAVAFQNNFDTQRAMAMAKMLNNELVTDKHNNTDTLGGKPKAKDKRVGFQNNNKQSINTDTPSLFDNLTKKEVTVNDTPTTVDNTNKQDKPRYYIICEECGKEVESFHHKKRFCSETCKKKSWRRENPNKSLKFKDDVV